MRKIKRRQIIDREETESSFEIDLSPMLSLMVTLIPIMLLTTQFTRVTTISTALPQIVEKAIQKDVKDKNKSTQISLKLFNDKNIHVYVQKPGVSGRTIKLQAVNEAWDFTGFHKTMVELKKQNPQKFTLDLHPEAKVKYDDIVSIMDEARRTKTGGEKFEIIDPETQEATETQLMFPEITFSNIVEA